MSDSILNNIPEINLTIKSEPIVAKTRKLRTVWTPELSQEISYYGFKLFDGIIEMHGETYINERFKEKYKGWNLPIIKIKIQLKKKEN